MLEIREATKSFGGLRAVDGVSLTVGAGQIAGLIGPNGAGKTSLFNLITGLYTLDSGEILLGGEPIHRLPTHRIAAMGIARTFQNIRLFGRLTALENAMIGRHTRTRASTLAAIFQTPAYRREEKETREKAREALAFVGLEKLATTRAADLPYGAQRRLEIARALSSEPILLLLDEPAAGMNETESEELVELIFAIREQLGVTVLLIEHDMRVVMNLCDHITVLNFGRHLAHGAPAEVRSHPAVIEAYLGGEPDVAER